MLVLLALPGPVAAQQPPPAASTSTPAPEQTIPLPLVSSRAEELGRALRDIEKRLGTEQDLNSLEAENQVKEKELRDKVRETDGLIAGVPKILELRELEWYWRVQRAQLAVPLNKLTRRANALEKDLSFLEGQKAQWEATLKQIQDRESFRSVMDLIRGLLADIQRAQSRLRAQLSLLLTVQNRFSLQDRMVSDVMERSSWALNCLRGDFLFEPGSLLLHSTNAEIATYALDGVGQAFGDGYLVARQGLGDLCGRRALLLQELPHGERLLASRGFFQGLLHASQKELCASTNGVPDCLRIRSSLPGARVQRGCRLKPVATFAERLLPDTPSHFPRAGLPRQLR